MDEHEPMRQDEEQVRQALEEAGPRPPLRDDDLAAIEAAARQAWQAKVAEVKAEAQQAETARLARRSSRWLRIAALLVFALVGVVLWSTRGGGPAPPARVATVETVDGELWRVGEDGETPLAAGDELPQGVELRSGGGGGEPSGRAALRLAGGTALRLDAGTRLRLAAASRVELAAGAVYADTDGGNGGPIEVATPLATVNDVGTRFLVRLEGGSEAASVDVAVREGEVRVANGETFRLGAGEAASVSAGGVERRTDAGHGEAWDWILAAAPPYAVDGRSLEEFLGWVEAETGWRIAYAEPSLARRAGEITLYGDVSSLRPDQAPFAVLPAANLAAEVSDGVLTVRQRR